MFVVVDSFELASGARAGIDAGVGVGLAPGVVASSAGTTAVGAGVGTAYTPDIASSTSMTASTRRGGRHRPGRAARGLRAGLTGPGMRAAQASCLQSHESPA